MKQNRTDKQISNRVIRFPDKPQSNLKGQKRLKIMFNLHYLRINICSSFWFMRNSYNNNFCKYTVVLRDLLKPHNKNVFAQLLSS